MAENEPAAKGAGAMQVKLLVCEEGKEPRTVALEGQTLIIGRGRACDLRLEHISVSRQHAQVSFDENGQCRLSDLGSRNGLLLNNRPLERPEPLRQGDQILIGPAAMTVLELDSPPGAEAPGEQEAATFGLAEPQAPEGEAEAEALPMLPLAEEEETPPPAEQEPASGLSAGEPAQPWAAVYGEALEALRADYDRLWGAVKSRTPPTLAGEMGSLHEAVEAGVERLARVGQGIEESHDRLAKLLEAARIISAGRSLRERLEKILDLAIAKMAADGGFLMLYSRRRRSLSLALQRGMSDLKVGLAIGESDPAADRPSVILARQALKSGTTVFGGLASGVAQDKGAMGEALMAQGIHAAICAPMKVGDRFIGLIYVDFRDLARLAQRPLGQEDADWLESLGSLAALAIENARLIEKSRRSASEKG